MENNEENLGSQEPTTNSNPVKTTNVKLIGIIAAAIVVILVVFFMFFTRSAKSTVKDYVKAMGKYDAKKAMALMDYEGAAAFSACSSYSGDVKFEDFEDKYDDIMDKLKDLDKDEKKDYEKAKEKMTDYLQDTLDEMKDEKAKFSIKNIKTEKVDDCKMLTKVTCDIKVKIDGKEEEKEDVTFYTMKKGMKHYIVSADM